MSDAPRAPLGAPSRRTTLAGPAATRPPRAAPPVTGPAADPPAGRTSGRIDATARLPRGEPLDAVPHDTPGNRYPPAPHHVDRRP